MALLAAAFVAIILVAAYYFYRRRQQQQMKYAILSMYEEADKPFQPLEHAPSEGALESDSLISPARPGRPSLQTIAPPPGAQLSAFIPPPSGSGVARPAKEKKRRDKAKSLRGMENVRTVQALIKEELGDTV